MALMEWPPLADTRGGTEPNPAGPSGGQQGLAVPGLTLSISRAAGGRTWEQTSHGIRPKRLGVPGGPARRGQVEPNLGVTITRANLWLVQAPAQTEQCVWHVMVMAAIPVATMETGRHFMAATLRWGCDQGELSLKAGVELAESGARRAVMDFWGRPQGFTQLGVPKRGWASVGRSTTQF